MLDEMPDKIMSHSLVFRLRNNARYTQNRAAEHCQPLAGVLNGMCRPYGEPSSEYGTPLALCCDMTGVTGRDWPLSREDLGQAFDVMINVGIGCHYFTLTAQDSFLRST